MEWLQLALSVLFALFGLACLLVVAIGLPGTWLLLGVAVLVECVDGAFVSAGASGSVESFGWRLLAICVGIGVVGEIAEAISGAAGAKLGGSSNRGMWGAILGGLIGAIALTPVIPIPLVGTLIGAVIGTFLGAWIAEATGPEARSTRETLHAALGAVVGRLGGILAKLAAGIAIWTLLVRELFGR